MGAGQGAGQGGRALGQGEAKGRPGQTRMGWLGIWGRGAQGTCCGYLLLYEAVAGALAAGGECHSVRHVGQRQRGGPPFGNAGWPASGVQERLVRRT